MKNKKNKKRNSNINSKPTTIVDTPSVSRISNPILTNLKKLFLNPYWNLMLLLIGMFSIYIPSLSNPPYRDDFYVVLGNEKLKSLSNVSQIMDHYFFNRGLVQLSFLLDWHWFSGSLVGMHAINLLLHVVATILVWWMVRLLWDVLYPSHPKEWKSWSGLIAAFFWGCHPINTEAINYLIARANIIASIFYVSGMVFALLILRTVKQSDSRMLITLKFLAISLFGGLCVGVGIGGKEIIVTLPAVIFITIALANRYRSKKETLYQLFIYSLPIGLVVLGYILYRISFFGALFAFPDVEARTPISNFITQACAIVCYYLPRIFFPVNLLFAPSFPIINSFTELRSIFSFSVISIILFLSVYFYRKRPEITLGILWFFIAISPTSSFIPLWDIIAERRVYLPIIGICIIVESIVIMILRMNAKTTQKWLYGFCGLMLAFFVIQTVNRNLEYRDPVAFWYKEYKNSPSNLTPIHNLIGNLISENKLDEAARLISNVDLELIADSNKHLSGDSLDFLLRVMLGKGSEKEKLKAMRIAEKHVEIHPRNTLYLNTLQIAYMIHRNYDKALKVVNQTLTVDPNHCLSLVNKSLIEQENQQYQQAIKTLEFAISKNRNDSLPYTELARLYTRISQKEKARNYYNQANIVKQRNQSLYPNESVLEVEIN
jgi:hypothetical protein